MDRGASLDLIEYEFERDSNVLAEEFAQWENQLDAETIKQEE
jgi:hypothetical protein